MQKFNPWAAALIGAALLGGCAAPARPSIASTLPPEQIVQALSNRKLSARGTSNDGFGLDSFKTYLRPVELRCQCDGGNLTVVALTEVHFGFRDPNGGFRESRVSMPQRIACRSASGSIWGASGDTAPASVHATLLGGGTYLGSVRTMYRLLAANGGSRERRDPLTHPAYTKPELLAIAPNQVWSWDITKLKDPAKWTCFHLYVILDIFSRFVVGWLIAPRECSELAQQLIADTVSRHNVESGMLTLHADRGAAMRSKPVASLLVDLDVAKSHSRPYVSDDNPYSESQFKTMKYRPEFPERFGCIEDARAHCQAFFAWYNDQHCHSAIGYMTPHSVHYGLAADLRVIRQATLDAAFTAHPHRFKGKRPQLPPMPTAAWINPPPEEKTPTSEPVARTLN